MQVSADGLLCGASWPPCLASDAPLPAEMDMSDSDSDAEPPAANGKANGSALGPPSAAAGSVPNELLFLAGLSDEVSEDALGALFGQ